MVISSFRIMPRFCGLVLGDMAALQDEFTHGKQEPRRHRLCV
jgi:hypothetical protein